MFTLYAIPVGILAGYLLGGRLDRLSTIRFRWAPLVLLGLAAQIALFSDLLAGIAGDAGPAIYVASAAAVLLAVLRNLDIAGLSIITLGAASNFIAIVANGGSMPAHPDAVAVIGGVAPNSNSTVTTDPVLGPLTDIFAIPAWVPFANVFSVGDVVLGIGIAVTIAIGMRMERPAKGQEGPKPGRGDSSG